MAKEKETEQAPARMITVDAATLEELVNAKVAALVAQIKGGTPNENFKEMMDRERGKDRPPIPVQLIPCKSPLTGATFTAKVSPSRKFPGGRIIDLLDYVHPEGTEKHVEEGGLVPKGMIMKRPDGILEAQYKLWRYREFWLKDLQQFNGKPMTSYIELNSVLERERLEVEAQKIAEDRFRTFMPAVQG